MKELFVNNLNKLLDQLPVDPVDAAESAELRYVCDSDPGIRRKKRGKGFVYVDSSNQITKEKKLLDRIASLVIPPAWVDVWICKYSNGHIQATGRDAKGRKQYIYHPKWDEIRNQTKFFRLIKFAESLPEIRRRVSADLRKHGLPREKVLAVITRLLEESLIRIGNKEYITNGSYGLTTLKDKHLVSNGSGFQLQFVGKSGKKWKVDILNKRIAKIVKQCQELPGQDLFQYIDEEGNQCNNSSTDVNNYLCEIIGENFTAKDFRTWGGTVHAAKALFNTGKAESEKDEKKKINLAVKEVASLLNNTVSICRSYYIHPHIFDAYRDASLFKHMKKINSNEHNTSDKLSREELSVLMILKSKLKN